MYEVAAVAVWAESFLQEASASLGLVLAVGLVILLQFMQTMGELAALLVGTVAYLHKLLAELRFLLVGRWSDEVFTRRLLCGEGVTTETARLKEDWHWITTV